MGVENGYGSRKNDVSDPFGIKGKWTVVRKGFPEQVEINSAEDIMKHGISHFSPSSVGATFGDEDGQKYLNWLNGHQPKNGR